MARVVCGVVFLVSALSGGLKAQNPPQYWGNDGCFYQWTGRVYRTELCRTLVAAYTFDYRNPVRRELLLRIYDNPANPYQDITFLNGQMAGWTARFGQARPGQSAVPAGIWGYRDPRGVWTNLLTARADTPAGRSARELGALINDAFTNLGGAIWAR